MSSSISSIGSLYNSLFSTSTTTSSSDLSDILEELTDTDSTSNTSTVSSTTTDSDSTSSSSDSDSSSTSLLDYLKSDSSSSSISTLLSSMLGTDTESDLISSILGTGSNSDDSDSDLFSIAASYSTIKDSQALIKKYYEALSKEADTSSSDVSKILESDSESLVKAANSLTATGTSSLFTADSNGDYDTDSIASAVSKFVEEYNNTIESASDSSNSSVSNYANDLVSETEANSDLLSEIGITINDDNTLTVDTDKLKEADISDIKTLFNGNSSYASDVSSIASQIDVLANIESKTYNSTGTSINSSSALIGSLLNSLI